MATPLLVKTEKIEDRNVQVIELEGQIDKSNIDKIDEILSEILESPPKFVGLDFNSISFINSEGIGFIVSYYYRLIKKDCKIHIWGLKDNVKDIFDLVGIPLIIESHESKEAFLNSISA